MVTPFKIDQYKPEDLSFETVMSLDLCQDIYSRSVFLKQVGMYNLKDQKIKEIYKVTKNLNKNIPFGTQTLREFRRYFSKQGDCWSDELEDFIKECQIFNYKFETDKNNSANWQSTFLNRPPMGGQAKPWVKSTYGTRSKRRTKSRTTKSCRKK